MVLEPILNQSEFRWSIFLWRAFGSHFSFKSRDFVTHFWKSETRTFCGLFFLQFIVEIIVEKIVETIVERKNKKKRSDSASSWTSDRPILMYCGSNSETLSRPNFQKRWTIWIPAVMSMPIIFLVLVQITSQTVTIVLEALVSSLIHLPLRALVLAIPQLHWRILFRLVLIY